MYQLKKLKSLLLLLLVAVTAKAQLSDGKVYNFVNVRNNTKSLVALSLSDLSIATTDVTAAEQLWYAEKISDGVFALRNLYSGYYLHSPNTQGNTKWTLVNRKDESCNFTCTEAGSGYALRANNTTNNGLYMHYGAGTDRIVCWDANSGTTASHWEINEVEKTDPIQELINNFPDVEAYQEHLNTLFEDKACTRLTSTYSSMNVETLKTQPAYVALPVALQQMVLKVRNGDNSWGEENLGGKPAWDASYAKKYRVQLYEPYNEPNCASTALSLNWHTNLNNPTGIFANEQEILYIMVEGEIKEGASLYLASYTGNGRLGWYADGIKLSEGLNVVTSYGDGTNYCINYVVETFDTSDGKRGHKAKARLLSRFPALKIHIEGGHINGYYNKVGDALYLNSEGTQGDKNADWDYLEARATQTTVTVLGKYMTLQFPLNDADTEGNKGLGYYLNDRVTVENVIDSWDNVMMWERLLLGVLDESTVNAEAKQSPYSVTQTKRVFEYTGNDQDFPAGYGDYYNVHGLALGVGGSAYMYGSGDHSGYHYNTMGGVIESMPTNAGSHWGPAHEIGHQHQNLLTVNGLTEVTNNLFSNVVLWYFGETTSRVNGDQGSLSNVLAAYNTEDSDFFTNNIWALTHMYYKLFLYYHVLGHNTKFYPRLFEMLRQDPMSGGYNQNGATSLLHFYKKCCLASGDDLTEFFRAHGFFSVMDNRLVGDYSNSVYTTTQTDIDAAIKEVKDLGYDENIAVLFINDATGETIKSHKGDNLTLYGETTVCAEVGSYASFDEEAINASYNCSISGNTVTMSGEGGVGFAIFNEKGEIIAFSDKKTFEISEECATAIVNGTAEVKALNSDNTVEEVEYDDTLAKYELLGILLAEVSQILALSDEDNSKPGFYRLAALAPLQAAYDKAQSVYDDKVSASYAAAYDALYREYQEVLSLTTDKTPFLPGSTYVLTNKRYPTKSIALGNENKLFGVATDLSSSAQQWVFESADGEDLYYLKNVSTEAYLGGLTKSGQATATATKKDDVDPYKLYDLGKGVWALQHQSGENDQFSLHCDEGSKIVGWWHTNSDNDASWWYLTATVKDESSLPLYNLQDLIAKAEALMSEVGEIVEASSEKIELTASDYYCNARCINTQWDKFSSYSVLNDGDIDTYLHTDYSGDDSEDEYAHYIRMDVGENNKVQNFKVNYTTRNYQYPIAPTSVTIEGSNDLTKWDEIESVNSSLPTAKGTAYTLPTMGNGVKYRYIRFVVKSTTSNQEAGPENNKHRYFALSELGISKVTYKEVLNSTYSSITEGLLLAAHEAASAARGVIATEATAEYTNAYTSLKGAYDNLLSARDRVNDAALEAKKQELLALVNSTTSLIASCGSVVPMPEESSNPTLQTTAADGDYYVWTNAQHATEGPISGLVDGKYGSSYTASQYFFHTDYSGNNSSDGLDHHITINLGEGNAVSKFKFQYWNRTNATANFIAEMEIYGKKGNGDYILITTINNMSATAGATYESSIITCAEEYDYLRFMVTKTDNTNNIKGGHPITHMAEFALTVISPAYYDVTLSGNAGGVTEDILLATYKQNDEAQATITYATTESQVEDAIEKLAAAKLALEIAQNASRDYTVEVVGGNGQGGVEYGGTNRFNGVTFSAPTTLGVNDLEAIPLTGYTDGVITMNGTTITITYNKVYTVEVTGGRGNGGITYDGIPYTDGATFSMLETLFDESKLSTIIPDGYEVKEEITVDDATGIISVVFSAIPLVDTEKYYTLACKATDHNNNTYIRDNGSVINGRSSEGSLFQFEKADEDNGYYIKSYVTGKYINHTAADDEVYASEEKVTVWTMEVPSHTSGVYTLTVGNNLYLNNVAGDCTDGSCANLQSKEHPGGTGSGNACSLWTITEGTPLDMTELLNLINATNSLIASCYQNGNVDGELVYFNSAYVTADVMAATKTAVTNAQAKYDNGRATTAGEYNTVLTALQAANTTLTSNISLAETEASDRLASREALREKIEALGDVIDLCGVVEWGRYPTVRVAEPLTEANLSTNAQEKSEGPIANLLKDDASHFHSSWKEAVGEEHYLQVDLGEGRTLQEFVFGYTTRSNGPHPYIIVVSGSNSSNDSFEEIKVFNYGLPNSGSTSWEATAPIVASQPYRYLRFTVTKSSDLRPYGEYCFAMSKFELKTITYSESEDYYVEYLNPNGSVTEEELLDAYHAMIAAGELDNVGTTKDNLDAKIEELQTLSEQLTTKRNTLQLPVELTTDIKNPVLYTFKSQRGDAKALQYDPAANHMFSIADADANSVKQMFYFTVGDTRTQVYVHPFVAGEQVLAANNTADGAAKVFAAINPAESMARQWNFESETIDASTWYSLKGVETPYFSHYGGDDNKMGFYSNKDAGSRFQFIDVDETTLDGSSAYHSLKVYYDEVTKVKSSSITSGSNVGYYPENEADAYNEAYATATSLLTGEEASYEANFAAYNALKVANEALVLNMPEVGKYYTIASACSDHRGGQLMYSTGENAMVFSKEMTRVKPEALWTFTSDGYLENLQTGCSVSTASTGGGHHKLGEAPRVVAIKSISLDGQVLLTPSGAEPLHAQDNGSVVVGWGDYDANSASAWRIEEVDMSKVKHTVSISKYEHAGLYLNYPVTIPDGVKAYYLDGKKITIDNGVGSLNLTKIEEDVIPAKTAVILYAPHGDQTVGYDFVYTEAQGGEYNNRLTGSAYQTYREAEGNHYYYVFGQNNGEIGLYKNGVKYNATGAEGTTHYKMSANKILFDWDGSVSNVSSFRFRLGTGGQTTSLEDALMMDNTIIYDLYGRRILEVKSSGLYIVNGEKRYIQVK